MRLLVILCSPRKNGVTDHLGLAFAQGAKSQGADVDIMALRDYHILPCKGCNACSHPPFSCILADRDDCEYLFTRIREARLTIFAAPVYFYALPAHFKALVDRGQRFWTAPRHKEKSCSCQQAAMSLFAAARVKGKLLFSGSGRTLSLFLNALGIDYLKRYSFRGLENPSDLSCEITDKVWRTGRHWAKLMQHSR